MIHHSLLLAASISCLVAAAGSGLHAEEGEKAPNSSDSVVIDGTGQSSQAAATPSGNLGKELHNPLSNLKEVIFQLDVLPDVGPYGKDAYDLSIQPVYPFDLPNDWKLVTYSILPMISQPKATPGGSRTSGLGDTSFYGYFVPPKEEGIRPLTDRRTGTGSM